MSGFQPPYSQPSNNQPPNNQPPNNQPPYGHAPDGRPPYGPGPAVSSGPVPLDQPYYGAGFGEAVRRFWRKYATFTGRASRSEFWWWQLVNALVAVVFGLVTSVITTTMTLTSGNPLATATQLDSGAGLVASIPSHLWALAVLVPTVAVTVRRLHDTDRSGWWYLLAVPAQLSGWVVLFVPMSTFLPSPAALGGLPVFPPRFWTFALVSLVAGAGSIIVLVLCIFAPKPRGARFDRR